MAGTNRRYYRARAIEAGLGESSTGKEQVAVSFEILTEGVPEKFLTWFGYFTDATANRTIESLRHCGWKGDDLTDISGLDQEVDLVVEEEEYEGKQHTKVQWVNRPGGLTIKTPLSPDKAKAFSASMRDRIRALDTANGTRTAPARSTPRPAGGDKRPEPPPLGDTDIPF
jgi:hypothetical protein